MPDAPAATSQGGNIQGDLHMPGNIGGRRKNIMREFTLHEISAVDRPAQEAAKMTIMKRDGGMTDEVFEAAVAKSWEDDICKRKFTAQQRKDLADNGQALPDGSYPIENKGDLQNAISAYGHNATPRVKAHIVGRAKALGAMGMLPDNWNVGKGVDEMPETDVKKLQKAVDDLTANVTALTEESTALKAKAKALEDEKEALSNKTKAVEEDLAAHKARASMSADEQKHFDGIDKHPTMGADAKKKAKASFLGADGPGRAKMMNAAKADDEVVKLDGQEIRKSEVGDASFAIFKRQAERMDVLEKSNKDEIDRRQTAEFSKRAEDEMPNLPGSVTEKVAMLKAIDGLDKAIKDTLTKMIGAGDKAIKAAFTTVGTKQGGGGADGGNFEKHVTAIAKRDSISKTEAMAKARQEFPDDFKAYQGTN